MADFPQAQAELRASYVYGGPGAIVSGVVWLAAATVASRADVSTGFAVLFFGGTLIFPVATLIVRTIFRRKPPSKDNPGERAVIETVFPMLGGLLAAWLLLPYNPKLVFPMAALAVGTHYFGFRTAYGDATYWGLASAMSLIGLAAIFTQAVEATMVPYAIAAVEIVFGLWLTWRGVSLQQAPSGG